ncbi:MAG: hypothetical protein ABIH92_03635 [Nanoarchaeota archaeon]
MKGKENLAVFLLALAVGMGLFLSYASAIEPNGATSTEVRNERAPNDTAGQEEAYAGNLSELTVTAFATTQTWQGYFGNVSGAIELADASGDVLYNWTLASPSGEVYASVNETITWSGIQCFNFTATGTHDTSGESAGSTSINGTNLTTLEARYTIDSSDADGVDETFTDANSHVEFYTANQLFSAGECLSTDVYDSTGAGVDGNFEEVLLYEPATTSVVYAALLESGAVDGYDGDDYDFEMLVLEDGHGSDTDTTTYYFFAEIE